MPLLWPYCPDCRTTVPPTEVLRDGSGRHERNYSRRADGFPDRWAVCPQPVLHIRVLALRQGYGHGV